MCWQCCEPACQTVGSDNCDEFPLALLRTACGRLLLPNHQHTEFSFTSISAGLRSSRFGCATGSEPNNRVVSRHDEQLILVDSDDREIGFLAKADAHVGRGTLHRAFSVFVFSPAGELLVQQRAKSKPLWPGHWSNTCCSHPRLGEKMDDAVRRRLQEELGLSAELEFLFKFQYQAQYDL
ncbi:isopentenyl-diphosphate Delta-isomerase [Mycobacterium sp.]|uniref:isopentenyl-diphosphate Delta-isomerase n=1 Tax=Mycobacterium sp. TaxID=1785 RepID=UPI003F812A48